MSTKIADKWFDGIDFVSIVDTIKGVMTSDGTMSTLLDFERVLDQCDLYAFKNWINGELVQGPDIGRYNVSCVFMWPYKLMPDPKAVKRLLKMGCKVQWDKTEIEVPIKVTNPDDFIQGTNYPKSAKRKVWLIQITIPLEVMDDIKEGSVDLAGSTVDLEELDDAYDEDLDKEGAEKDENEEPGQQPAQPMAAPVQ
jgi:hypothetical protein